MTTWMQIFCISAIVTIVLVLLLCLYSTVYLSSTISQAEEKHEQ